MKTAHRAHWLMLFLLCLLTGIFLVGCRPSSGSGENSSPETETGGSLPEDGTVFPVSLLAEMKIIYREGASSAIIDSAQALAEAIRITYHTDIPVTSDYIRKNSEHYCEKEYEIIVGSTNRTQDDAYENMRLNDSVYTAEGSKILIIGGNEYATTEAVTNFTYDIVTMKKGGNEVFYNTAWNQTFIKEYPINSLTVNGVPITEYSIVYSRTGTDFESGIAQHLANKLELLTGYSIPVKQDTADAQGYEILIGRTNRSAAREIAETGTADRNGVIGTVEKQVVLSGADPYGINTAVECFLNECEAAANAAGISEWTLTGSKTAVPSESLSIMTFNVQTWGMSTKRNPRVIKMISTYLPDILGVQEANNDWMELLNQNFAAYYTVIGLGRDENNNGQRTAILVAKKRFEVLEEGTRWLTDTPDAVSKLPDALYRRIYTYAMLSDQVSGHTFLHINTHFDNSTEAVRMTETNYIFEFLHNYENVPVVLTGDLNAIPGSSTIRMIQKGGLTSTSDMWDGKNAYPRLDWIFTAADCAKVDYFRICNERVNGDYASDHHPVLIKISFFIPEGGIHHDFSEILPVSPDGYLDLKRDEEGKEFAPIIRIL